MVPMVQANVLGAEAVNEILGSVPLQIVAVLAVVTEGFGFTVVAVLLLTIGLAGPQLTISEVKTTLTT
jgi:energy-converting hydrogenase Eha subunit C